MFKIGGKFNYIKSSNGVEYFKQKRLNIIQFQISIPLTKNKMEAKNMEKTEMYMANEKYKIQTCVNFDSIKEIVEEEDRDGYVLLSVGKSDTFMGTGNVKKAGNFLMVFKKEE